MNSSSGLTKRNSSREDLFLTTSSTQLAKDSVQYSGGKGNMWVKDGDFQQLNYENLSIVQIKNATKTINEKKFWYLDENKQVILDNNNTVYLVVNL